MAYVLISFVVGLILTITALLSFLICKVRYPTRSRYCPSGIEGVDHPSELGWPCESIAIEGHEGVLLRGWFVRAASAAKTCLLLLHGHRKHKTQMLRHAAYLRPLGYDLLFLDLRHHGESGDGPVALGAYSRLDLAAVLTWLQNFPRTRHSRFAAFGISLGATIACVTALDGHPLEAVVADSPSADQGETMADYGWILYRVPRPISRLCLATAMRISGIDFDCMRLEERLRGSPLPVLIIHGEADSRVPYDHALRLAAVEPRHRRRLVSFPTADHVGSYDVDPERYQAAVTTFLAEHIPAVPTMER